MRKYFSFKVPLYLVLLFICLSSIPFYYFYSAFKNESAALRNIQFVVSADPKITQVRLHNYIFTKPLLFTKVLNESVELKNLKSVLEIKIQQLKSAGIVNDASVYVKLVDQGDWIDVNNTSTYMPGSIIKIPAVMTYLKMCEGNPALINTEYLFRSHFNKIPLQSFNEKALIPGKKYKAKELLYEILVNSNNDATQIINNSVDINLFKKLFVDLEIPEPDIFDTNYSIDARDLSRFLRVLYNATYLNADNSEFCLSLLAQSPFKIGIVNELPANTKVAHKFGETETKSEAQLHETALVYAENHPYVITIMTKGGNVKSLPQALSSLSKLVFDELYVYDPNKK